MVCALGNSSPQNQNAVDYIHKLHDLTKQKSKFYEIQKKKVSLEKREEKLKERQKLKQFERKLKKKR